DPAVRRARGHRRHRLLPDGLWSADRDDDARADRGAPGRRLAQARRALHGAGPLAPPGDRRAPGDRRRASRHDRGRRRDRLGARQPRGGRGHRRLPPPRAGRPAGGGRRPRARARRPRRDRRGLMSTPANTSRRPGRPRSERARKAILEAAADLLLDEGTAHVSMDVVAERAGVSKATIYRWWPSKERLALDALLEWAGTGRSPRDTGSLRGDLLALIRPW